MGRKETITAAKSKPYHHGDLRQALILGGLQVLAKQGIHGLNLREVARVAGVSHTAPYRHFADKDALVAAIAEDGFRQLTTVIDSANQCGSDQATDKLLMAAELYVRFALEHTDHFKVMFSGVRHVESHPGLYAISKQGFNFLLTTIIEGQRRKELVEGEPEAMAKTIWALMHGLATLLIEKQFPVLQGTATEQKRQAQQFARQAMHMLMAGLHR